MLKTLFSKLTDWLVLRMNSSHHSCSNRKEKESRQVGVVLLTHPGVSCHLLHLVWVLLLVCSPGSGVSLWSSLLSLSLRVICGWFWKASLGVHTARSIWLALSATQGEKKPLLDQGYCLLTCSHIETVSKVSYHFAKDWEKDDCILSGRQRMKMEQTQRKEQDIM